MPPTQAAPIWPLERDPPNVDGTDELKAKGGEVAYYHALEEQVRAWVAAHPWEFLNLSVRRFIEFFLPPRWFWSLFWGGHVHLIGLRQSVIWASTLGGLATLVMMARRRRPYGYILIAVLGCSLIYILVQPIPRYRYMISTILIFCALDGAFRLLAHIRAMFRARRSGAFDMRSAGSDGPALGSRRYRASRMRRASSWTARSPAARIRPPFAACSPSQVVTTPPAPSMIGTSATMSCGLI